MVIRRPLSRVPYDYIIIYTLQSYVFEETTTKKKKKKKSEKNNDETKSSNKFMANL